MRPPRIAVPYADPPRARPEAAAPTSWWWVRVPGGFRDEPVDVVLDVPFAPATTHLPALRRRVVLRPQPADLVVGNLRAAEEPKQPRIAGLLETDHIKVIAWRRKTSSDQAQAATWNEKR